MSNFSVSWRAAKKCEQTWTQAVHQLRRGDQRSAAALFDTAVAHDPTAADAWLGLHAAGWRQAEAVQTMARFSHTFGALRTKAGLPLSSRYNIGGYVTSRLETARDLWLATMAGLLFEGRLDDAGQFLSTAVPDCDETRFILTRYAFLRNDWPLVLEHSRGITDGFLLDEAQLYTGIALWKQGVNHEALRVLGTVPQELGAESGFAAEVAYFRGRALDDLDRADEALQQYQFTYRLQPDFVDVAERAQART
ncbi:tetratricopeptide repeat protein, partial [Streptomyces flavofungini]|uniref:tetratricopeptide repeat protein n=1 Tax=Streptomyces flavofungini TaxID=68200 RepID=UPI0034DFFAFD